MELDIRGWLEGLGLGIYADAFEENCIDAQVLPHLTGEDLKEIGVSAVGHRRKLLAACAALRPGAPTGPDAEPAEAPGAEPPSGELRQVTVLFSDICGFTKLSAAIGSEKVHALLAAYFDRADQIIRDHGGTVDKHIGDSVMAVFGAPIAHGNDDARAVRAAIAIRGAMPGLSERVGSRLEVHIGIASGQVVASGIGRDAHYTVIGDSVNLAARLTDRAVAGEILISGSVQEAVAGLLATTDLGEIEVKGLAAPVRAYSVREGPAKRERRQETPFVGRLPEMRQVAGALELCLEAGTGQLLFIRGDAGIGKTRLTDECCHMAEAQGFVCHRSLVLDFGVGKAQEPIRALIRSLLGVPDGSGPDRLRAAVEHALADGLVARENLMHLNDLLDLPNSAEDKLVHDAMDNPTRSAGKRATVAMLARQLSARRPRMIIFEDLHWADEIVLQHIAELGCQAAGCPLLIVMTSRINGDPLSAAWRASVLGTAFMTLDLGPLSRQDSLAMASRYLGTAGGCAESCIERAAGNPLFLEQLLRSAEEVGELHVPGSVQSIVQARLDTLPPADKAAVQAASVLGQRFALDALRHLIGEDRYDASRLFDHHLVRRQGDEVLFAHALVREGVYASLLSARRKELHMRAAGWFASSDAALRADHLERAGSPLAAEAYLDAAQGQARALRFVRARQLAERGLAVAVEPSTRHALNCQLGDILRELGDPERSIAAYEEALTNSIDDAMRSHAWLGLAEGMRIVERIDEALALVDRAQPIAEALGLSEILMRLHHLRGNLLFPKGDIAGCETGHRQSLIHAREIGSAEGEARGLGGLGDAAYVAGRMRTAHDELARCVAICRTHGFGRVEVANAAQICHTKIYRLELREALENGAATIEAARRVGHDRAELNAQLACLFATIELGDMSGADAVAVRIDELSDKLGSIRFRNEKLAFQALRLKAGGEAEAALAAAREAISLARQLGLSFGGPRMLGILARVTTDPGEQDDALADAERVMAEGCVGHNQLYFYRDAIEVTAGREDWARVERYADALAAFTAAEPLPWSDYFAARGRALAASARGACREGLAEELRRLHDEGARIGLTAALPALVNALQAT